MISNDKKGISLKICIVLSMSFFCLSVLLNLLCVGRLEIVVPFESEVSTIFLCPVHLNKTKVLPDIESISIQLHQSQLCNEAFVT